MSDIKKFHQACREVIQAANDYPKTSMIQYAKSYAQGGLRLTDTQDVDEVRTQALYILNNLRYWRGILATNVKNTLKEFTRG